MSATNPNTAALYDRGILPTEGELQAMARRRHQSPTLLKSQTKGGKHDRWSFRAYVDVLTGGGRKRVEKSFPVGFCSEMGRREAQSKMAEMVAALNQPAQILQSQVKFGYVIDKWIKNSDVRPQTLAGYESNAAKHFRPQWGDVRIPDITPLAVEEWIREKARGLSKNTVVHLRSQFTQIWNCALRWELTEKFCPMTKVPKVKTAGKPERKKTLPTIEQLHELLTELTEEHRNIVTVAAGTGMRIGEILALRWRHLSGEYLLIEESMTPRGKLGPVKTKESERTIPVKHLQLFRPGYVGDEDFVFTCGYDSFRRAISKAAKDVGIHYDGFGAHTFRRLFNTMLRRSSEDVALAQAQLGHVDAKTNNLYLIPGLAELKKRASVVEGVWGELMGDGVGGVQ